MQSKATIKELIERGDISQWNSDYIFTKANVGYSLIFAGNKYSGRLEILNTFIEAVPSDVCTFGFQSGSGLYREEVGNFTFKSLSRPVPAVMADYEAFKKEEGAGLLIIDEVRGGTEANILADAAIFGLSVWTSINCENIDDVIGKLAGYAEERLGEDLWVAKNRLSQCQFVIIGVKDHKVTDIKITS